jgi:hypothetical protein
LQDIEHFVVELAVRSEIATSGLLCLVTSEYALNFVEPMPRSPQPEVGFEIGADLGARIEAAIRLNLSIHDGAIVCKKDQDCEVYKLAYWSCRLFPPRQRLHNNMNRGSAFNSALAASYIAGFESIFFWSKREVWCFVNGTALRIHP